MTVGQRPTVRRRRLRSDLRQRREDAGLTQDQVATAMDWSLSKLVRIEAGSVGISTNDLRALLGLYGVQDLDLVNELLDLARSARQRMWWAGYRDMLGPAYLEFIGFEAEASTIRYFHPTLIPALLQTEAYARAIISGGARTPYEPDQIDTLVDVRLTRISSVLDRDEPPELVMILDEAVVHRLVGGPAVMREQLAHLVDMASRPYATIRLIPFETGAHPGSYGSFALLEFTDPTDDVVLYLESAPTDMVLRDRPAEITMYRGVFDLLLDVALSEEDTVARLERVAAGLTRRHESVTARHPA